MAGNVQKGFDFLHCQLLPDKCQILERDPALNTWEYLTNAENMCSFSLGMMCQLLCVPGWALGHIGEHVATGLDFQLSVTSQVKTSAITVLHVRIGLAQLIVRSTRFSK
ncbi:hypothetical protein PM082_019234 [Marasmius tenuissimus]|nr:hypothetical protein PM082_019234 [Marasmius tenuissimus]